MRSVAILGCCLLVTGCTQTSAPKVEQNSKEVVVQPDVTPFFPPLKPPPQPSQFGPLDRTSEPVRVVLPKRVAGATVSTFPRETTAASELREVHVKLDVVGALPAELSVEFTSPSGQIFDRQSTQLTGSPLEHQTAEFTLPVMGTLIDSSSIIGTWQARFLLENDELSSVSFEVTQ